jgi:hypothetical protein
MISGTGYSCPEANYRSLVAGMRTTNAGPRQYALMCNQWAGCGAAVVLARCFAPSVGSSSRLRAIQKSRFLGDSLRPTKLDDRRAGTRWGRDERFPSAA